MKLIVIFSCVFAVLFIVAVMYSCIIISRRQKGLKDMPESGRCVYCGSWAM